MKVYITRKVAPKRNRTTIKKIIEQEFKWNRIKTRDITKARFFHYKFVGTNENPQYILMVGITNGKSFEGDKVELLVKGTNAYRLSWLLSNRYKYNKKAKNYKGAELVKGGKTYGNQQGK